MSNTRRAVVLSTLMAIALSVQASELPGDFSERPGSRPGPAAPPLIGAQGGAATQWAQLSPWATEGILRWNESLVISFGNGQGLWLYEAGEWFSLTSANPYLMRLACDRLFAAFPSGGGLWSYDPIDGWERISLSEPARLIPAGTSLLADFEEQGLWAYDCVDPVPVYLRLDELDTPPVTGAIQGSGTCSGNPTIPCTSDFVCASAQPPAGFCENIPCVRTINEWTAGLSNVPKNALVDPSPFNDIILDRLMITYDPALSGVSEQVIGLGGVAIPAGGSGSVSFFPIPFQALAEIPIDESTTTNVTLVFEGHTPVNAEVRSGPSSVQLFIEQCFGGE